VCGVLNASRALHSFTYGKCLLGPDRLILFFLKKYGTFRVGKEVRGIQKSPRTE
jgi:hypothetical protein